MKTFYQTLLIAALMIVITGCASTKIPNAVDQTLPKVNSIKTISGTTEIGLEWTSYGNNDNVLGYYLYRSDPVSGKMNKVANIKDKFSTHYVDQKLAPETQYKYSMRTYGLNGMSPEGIVVLANTSKLLDSVPFAKAIYGLPQRVKLIWRPHPDLRVNSYVIERRKTSGSNWSKIAEVKGRLSAEYIDKSVASGQSYEYRIFVKTSNGAISKPSDILSAQTKKLPDGVINLKATNNLPKKIVITWDSKNDEDFSHYKIYSARSEYLPFLELGETKDNSFEDYINDNGATRYYKVTVVDKDGLESKKQDDFVYGQTLTQISAPILNEAVYDGNKINLSWRSYDQRAKFYTVIRNDGYNKKVFENISSTSMNDTDITHGSTYKYRIYATDEYGINSDDSNEITVKTN